MKSTNRFKQTIQAYLNTRAGEDPLFAVSYAKPNKNIDDCITCILNTVQKSGCNGFTDEEIYSMAVHYFDEDTIVVGKPMNCEVVVNHTVELTDDEKEQAHKEAVQRLQSEAYAKLTQPKKKVVLPVTNNSLTLFD